MKTLPLTISNEDKILIVAPHPDDESIGAGGLLAMYPNQCIVVVMTDGRYGNDSFSQEEMIKIRQTEFENAMNAGGIIHWNMQGNEDGSLIANKQAFDHIDISGYTYLLLPNPADHHSDHTACYKYFMEKVAKAGKSIKVLAYEVHNPLSEVSMHLDITDVINKKKEMISCYSSQISGHNYSDQIVSLAAFRAFQNENNGRYFETYLQINSNENGYESQIELELAKYKWFTRVFARLLEISKEYESFAHYILDKGYTNIGIYGYGIAGKKLYQLLADSDCKVNCIIDVNAKKDSENIPLFHDISSMGNVDVVIVTTFLGYKEIADKIEKQCSVKTISLNELTGL